jgi:hypothetical protein
MRRTYDAKVFFANRFPKKEIGFYLGFLLVKLNDTWVHGTFVHEQELQIFKLFLFLTLMVEGSF